jgi:Arc/MetJ-type ribon-helix-helix transcriptional regulator
MERLSLKSLDKRVTALELKAKSDNSQSITPKKSKVWAAVKLPFEFVYDMATPANLLWTLLVVVLAYNAWHNAPSLHGDKEQQEINKSEVLSDTEKQRISYAADMVKHDVESGRFDSADLAVAAFVRQAAFELGDKVSKSRKDDIANRLRSELKEVPLERLSDKLNEYKE